MSNVVLSKMFGRTGYAIEMLFSGKIEIPLQGTTPFAAGSLEEAGFIAEATKHYTELLRLIFRKAKYSAVWQHQHAFSITTYRGTIMVPAGLVKEISLNTLPHNTTLMLYNEFNQLQYRYDYAGNRDIR